LLPGASLTARIHVTEGTVKRHLSNTYHKMEVGSRGEAVRAALLQEWITISDISEEEQKEEA
jgi:FixJ family two-component response regulator